MKRLTPAQRERLDHLIEEAAEVIQAATKCLRHGFESNNNGKLRRTNLQHLAKEIGDLRYAESLTIISGDLGPLPAATDLVWAGYVAKTRRFPLYQHHQPKRLLAMMDSRVIRTGRRRK